MAGHIAGDFKPKQWAKWECWVMNRLDFRYWDCVCGYEAPYGFVMYGDCPTHEDCL